MNEIRVSSWVELQEALFEDSWNPSIRRFRSPYAYRGVADAKSPLVTSLMRLGGPYHDMEAHLLRNFRKYAHNEAVEVDSVWHWLALAQHHGLPTRLLDWTYSPFVAMHFATVNTAKYASDSAIWMVNYNKLHKLLPSTLQQALQDEGADVLPLDVLASVVGSLQELEALAEAPFLLFLEPPSMDERIVNQYALFSILSDAKMALDTWLAEHLELWRKVVIPASLKWEIRDKLDQSNVTERVLFPGLDGLSHWLKRLYSPSFLSEDDENADC